MKKYKRKFDVFKVILSKNNPTIVEIGAHFGEDSMRFAEAFPEAQIHCFEPDPRCIEVFKKYVKNKRIILYELTLVAVSLVCPRRNHIAARAVVLSRPGCLRRSQWKSVSK